jgi:hypothetical protein
MQALGQKRLKFGEFQLSEFFDVTGRYWRSLEVTGRFKIFFEIPNLNECIKKMHERSP